ncbi:MAG TPA: response regulator [Bryobacteraceae bacterium]
MPASLLIADSSSAMRAFVERAIGIAGLPVSACHQASDAQQLLRLVRSREVDFLLVDTHLIGMNEETWAEAISAAREAAIPFLVTSPDASFIRIERALQSGACDYLLKPFSIPTLCAKLETALRTAHAKN